MIDSIIIRIIESTFKHANMCLLHERVDSCTACICNNSNVHLFGKSKFTGCSNLKDSGRVNVSFMLKFSYTMAGELAS